MPTDYESLDHDRKIVVGIYLLFLAGVVTVVSPAIGFLLALHKRKAISPDWQSHLDFQIRTFIFGIVLLFLAVAIPMTLNLLLTMALVLIPITSAFAVLMNVWLLPMLLILVGFWLMGRNIKGLLKAIENTALEKPSTLLW